MRGISRTDPNGNHGAQDPDSISTTALASGKATSPEEHSLESLLDCLFGRGDTTLSLFWSGGSSAVDHLQAHGDARQEGEQERRDGGHDEDERRLLGTAVLRRADLLPLVRQTSARIVFKLPIRPSSSNADEFVRLLPPDVLELAITYRREPSAVARRKSHGWCARRRTESETLPAIDRSNAHDLQESHQELNSLDDAMNAPEFSSGDSCDDDRNSSSDQEQSVNDDQAPSSPRRASEPPEGSVGESAGNSFASSRESEKVPVDDAPSRTEHLLPARATVCFRVEHFTLTSGVVSGHEAHSDSERGLLWVSFTFPAAESMRQKARKQSGVFVWEDRAQQAEQGKTYWSPTVAAGMDGERERIPLDWDVEVKEALLSLS